MPAEDAYKKAFSAAETFVYKTHYLMTKANLPSWASGGDVGSQFAKTAYTFRRFTHNYLLSLMESLKGPDGKLALDVILRSLAYTALLGGIFALAFLDDILDEIEKFTGEPLRASMKQTMRDWGGPVMERMGEAGIPSLIGINISGSLKTNVPFLGGTPSDTVYGVYAGMAKKGQQAMTSIDREEYLRALESASPVMIESILKAYRMSERGATTVHGKAMFDEQGKPIKLTPVEAATQFVGFRPERIAAISGEEQTRRNVTSHFSELRKSLYDRFRLADTPEERTSVRKEIQNFNLQIMKFRGAIAPITSESLRKAAAEKPNKKKMLWDRQFGEGANT
jgi:hypothetical protein